MCSEWVDVLLTWNPYVTSGMVAHGGLILTPGQKAFCIDVLHLLNCEDIKDCLPTGRISLFCQGYYLKLHSILQVSGLLCWSRQSPRLGGLAAGGNYGSLGMVGCWSFCRILEESLCHTQKVKWYWLSGVPTLQCTHWLALFRADSFSAWGTCFYRVVCLLGTYISELVSQFS